MDPFPRGWASSNPNQTAGLTPLRHGSFVSADFCCTPSSTSNSGVHLPPQLLVSPLTSLLFSAPPGAQWNEFLFATLSPPFLISSSSVSETPLCLTAEGLSTAQLIATDDTQVSECSQTIATFPTKQMIPKSLIFKLSLFHKNLPLTVQWSCLVASLYRLSNGEQSWSLENVP